MRRPGYEHVLLRVGKDEEDDMRRQKVFKEMMDWLEKHTFSAARP